MKDVRDKFTRKAKGLGFRARSVFKLEAIVKKYRFVGRRDVVLDLGAAPGSWVQYLVSLGCRYVLGVDITPVAPIVGADLLKKSVMDEDIVSVISSYRKKFSVVISDMMAKTTGQSFVDQANSVELCERAFFIATHVLKVNGNFLCKIFQSREADEFLFRLRKEFKFVKTMKPVGSKSKSKEVFYVCMGYKQKAF